jgi:hypothetical protein
MKKLQQCIQSEDKSKWLNNQDNVFSFLSVILNILIF